MEVYFEIEKTGMRGTVMAVLTALGCSRKHGRVPAGLMERELSKWSNELSGTD